MANCMATLPLILVLCAVSSASALQFPLNVDCGTSGTVTTAGFLDMTWVGDEGYIKSGLPGKVQKTNDSLIPPLRTLRYFPERKKNCYSFPGVGQGNKILVRAWFYYGNYDGRGSPPTFDLLFNGNLWGTVLLSKENPNAVSELVHVNKVDDVSVCLVRTNDTDVPFINSLEINQLDHNLYSRMDVNFPLYLKVRYAYGSPYTYTRYPNDSYDRLWFGFESDGVRSLTLSSDPIIDIRLAADNPPAAVVRQAITTLTSEASTLTIPFPSFDADITEPAPHYANFYFVEMLLSNASRSVDILLDDKTVSSETINIPTGRVKEVSIPNVNLSTNSTFTLLKAGGSTHPPLISAAEIFRIGYQWRESSTDPSDVKALSYIQESYEQLQEWSGDPCLPNEYAWEWVGCSNDSKPQVTALNLSGYGLTGPLVDFSNLASLQTIDLHNNSLSGSIPEFLGNLPNLKQLNLVDNQFNGSLPESLTRNPNIDLNFSGNNVSDNPKDSAKKTNVGVVAGAVISSLLCLLLLVMIAVFIFKKRPSDALATGSSVLLEPEIKQAFSHAEIVEITNNFEKILGGGGSGNVYYGRLRNGPEVAVKVLKDSLSQRTKEFVAEAKLLMTVHHRCLVSFVGYCEEDGKLILLYEYMSGGNVRQLLSGRSSTSALHTWTIRLQIALRVATGPNSTISIAEIALALSIPSRDVKTTNILLNAKMEAKVADFGLSKVGQKDDETYLPTVVSSPPKYIDPVFVDSCYGKMDDVTQLSTVVAGTPGYIDPEYYSTSLVTKKSDVYSFGVVLLELITGYPPLFTVSEERFHIVQWVTPRLARRDIHGVADPKLRGQYDVNSLWKVADIAMSCTTEPSHLRPNMSNVVDQLKEAVEMENNCQYGSSDTLFTEVQLSSSSSYETPSSFPSASHVPPPR